MTHSSKHHHTENDNEWMNNKYATAVMAGQQNNFTLTSYDCDRTLFSQHDNNCLQHHVYQERQSFIPVHNEVPTSSIGYIDNRITAGVSCPPRLIDRLTALSSRVVFSCKQLRHVMPDGFERFSSTQLEYRLFPSH